MKLDKKNIIIAVVTLAVGFGVGWLIFGGTETSSAGQTEITEHDHEGETIWTCSMHPQIKMDKPGLCPICGMDLIPLDDEMNEEASDPNEIQMSEAAIKLAEIQTATVQKGQAERTVYLLGTVKPDERNIAELTARFGGRIEKLNINFTGQNVRKGDKLATIYSPELISAQRELLEALKYKETNPGFYKAARTKLALWDLTEDQIDEIEISGDTQHYFPLLSPISGTITKRDVSIGDYIKVGSPMFEVINLKKVWVMFDAYESDLPWINNGDVIDFAIQSLPGRNFTGKVKYIDPFIDEKTRVAKIRIELNNSNLELKPEMFANGVLNSEMKSTGDILIPKSAILWTGKRAVVFVKVADRKKTSFLYREIVMGPEAGNFYVVSSGLQEGEEIAVNGVFKIDAAAQLAGKASMMNPEGGKVSAGHDHGGSPMSDEEMKKMPEEKSNHTEHAMLKVYGNCGMCESRIEKAAGELKGVITADWDKDTKMMHLEFDSEKVSVDEVEKAMAAVGHDTENHRAPDAVYEDLPGCCLYEREIVAQGSMKTKMAMVKVYGNCGVCESRIEEAAGELKGVITVDWNQDTKMMHLEFNSGKVSVDEVEKAIAAVGHDTENHRAPDAVYEDLPGCCLYDRPKNN